MAADESAGALGGTGWGGVGVESGRRHPLLSTEGKKVKAEKEQEGNASQPQTPHPSSSSVWLPGGPRGGTTARSLAG